MTAIAKFDKAKELGRWQRRSEAHDPCLLSFRCRHRSTDIPVTDAQLRWKGFLTFWDSVADPMAGTGYVICTQPQRPRNAGAYFERVGQHLAWVMTSSQDDNGE